MPNVPDRIITHQHKSSLKCIICHMHCIGDSNDADFVIDGLSICAPHIGYVRSKELYNIGNIIRDLGQHGEPAPE